MANENTETKTTADVDADNAVSSSPSHWMTLPPPALLAEYEKFEAGTAERIIKLVEQQQRHRHDLELELSKQNDRAVRSVRRIGIVIIACSAAIGVWLSLNGAQLAGAIMGGFGTVGPLITLFVFSSRVIRNPLGRSGEGGDL